MSMSAGEPNIHLQPFLDAFKGFILSHKLEPYDAGKANSKGRYRATFTFYDTDDGSKQLYIDTVAVARVLSLLEEIFPSEIDRDKAQQALFEKLDEWITSDPSDPSDQLITNIESLGTTLVREIGSEIHRLVVYIPLYGINLEINDRIQIGNCILQRNNADSDFSKLVKKASEKEKIPKEAIELLEATPAVLSFHSNAHLKRAIINAKEEAELSCHILMLFFGSYYYNTYQSPRHPKRLSVGAPIFKHRDDIFLAALEEDPLNPDRTGWQQEFSGQQSFLISRDSYELMVSLGLERINRLIQEASSANAGEMSRRIKLAITWFGKSCSAGTIAESFIDNAIAIEALLTQGRTPQSKYAEDISMLVAREEEAGLYPMMQPISKDFSRPLFGAKDLRKRREVVRDRAQKLLSYRNQIVHGNLQFDLCDPLQQLDFEALVRNSILSFISGSWNTLRDFTIWKSSSEVTNWLSGLRKALGL
jgi:hypothetical protein